MPSWRARIGAVALVPFAIAAWIFVPLLGSSLPILLPAVILAGVATVLSVVGAVAQVYLRSLGRDIPQTAGRETDAGPSGPADFVRGWVVFLGFLVPAALLILAAGTSSEPLLFIAIVVQIVMMTGTQALLVSTIAGPRRHRPADPAG
jgi:hypothetical protein